MLSSCIGDVQNLRWNMVLESIKSHLGQHYGKVYSFEGVAGGCIGENYKVITDQGSFFLKTGIALEMIKAEALGLEALSGFVPKIFESTNYLLLEWIESKEGTDEDCFEFGKRLAKLHQNTNEFYGFSDDNFLGRTPQKNKPNKSWLEFFWNERLMYQIDLAYKNFKLDSKLKDFVYDLDLRYEELIGPSIESPSLIHGDLWSGNYLFNKNGKAYLIDPAVCYAHRELELSMTKLFGGFSASFYEGYQSYWPLQEGSEERIDFYQIYHLLNHLNLFGMSYYNQVIELLRKHS